MLQLGLQASIAHIEGWLSSHDFQAVKVWACGDRVGLDLGFDLGTPLGL